MILAIHQPEHLPWLGFFDKAAQADVLVLLDNVQYRHKYFQNRNRIRGHDGACWLNVPVLLKDQGHPLIKNIRINDQAVRWREKCWRSISLNYRKAKFFPEHETYFKAVYERPWERLSDLNVELIRYLCRAFGIGARIGLASEMGVEGAGPELILRLVLKTGADVYVSGVSGIAGQGKEPEELFSAEGIGVQYQQFFHPIYRQLHEPFMPCMSAIDLLFNYGAESMSILRGAEVPRYETKFE